MAVKRFGDWEKAKALLTNPGLKISAALQRATIKVAVLLVREIKKGIRDQAPGGEPFAPLAESTVKRKGSSKALIDTGFLINKITQLIVKDKAFVGLLRGTVHPKSGDLVNIGAVMEYGATIRHPNGAVIVIPPRPFLHPVMVKYRGQIQDIYREALARVFD